MQKFTDVLNVGEQSLAADSSESPLLVFVLAQRCEQVRNSSNREPEPVAAADSATPPHLRSQRHRLG